MKSFGQRPTLADVAAEAGVSTVTVSRVIEDSPKVTPKTKERVKEAMARLGYFGNAAASSLVSGRSTSMGVVSANTADYGYATTIRGIERAARAADMSVLISVIEGEDEESVGKGVASVASRALAGVVVMDFDTAAHAVLPALPDYLPVVATTQPNTQTARPYVYIDEYLGAQMAAEHLIGLGHRSIFVLAPPDQRPAERRSLGVLDALTDAHLPHYPVIRCADWQPRSGYDGATRLLSEYGAQVTAIACANDEVAVGAMRAVQDAGLRVPEDVSIVGFDDHPMSEFVRPALTTIHQDFEALGALAFRTLTALIDEHEPPSETAVLPTLKVRESTSAANPERGPGH